MLRKMIKSKCVMLIAGLTLSASASAGLITSHGAVTALTDINQLDIYGTADFNNNGVSGNIALNSYSAFGLTFHTGTLTSALAGVTASGSATTPYATNTSQYFPGTIAGGGSYDGLGNYHAGVATFSHAVTQIGLTASRNGSQYLTVWDTLGQMIGQVNWQPANDAAFIGLDTGDVAIGMVTYGNDNMWNGATYSVGGATIISDNWVWNSYVEEGSVDGEASAPGVLSLMLLGVFGLIGTRRKRSK